MATVDSYTKAKSDEIYDATVVDGNIDGAGHLILVTRGGTNIDAGSTVGPQGPTGPAGSSEPTGVVTMFAGATAPAGYLLCNGAVVSRTTYAALFAVIGTAFGAGDGSTTFQLPDLQNRFPVGKGSAAWSDSMNEKGGQTDAHLPIHNHIAPAHTHSNAHNHPSFNTGFASATHSHGVTDGGHAHYAFGTEWNFVTVLLTSGPHALDITAGSGATVVNRTQTNPASANVVVQSATANHDHSVAIPAYSGTTGSGGNSATTDAGSDGSLKNLPPYITMNFIIKT